MKRILLALAILIATCLGARAQSTVTVIGPITPGDCVKFNSTTVLADNGTTCNNGAAATPGGVNGSIQYNSGGNFGGFVMNGDCLTNTTTGVIICTKTNGVAFGPLATLATLPTTTRIGKYANDFGWTLQSPGPEVMTFTAGQFPGTSQFTALTCISDSKSLYVGIGNAVGTQQVVKMDVNTWAVQAVINVGTSSSLLNSLALAPGKLWLSDVLTGNLYRIDLNSNTQDLTVTTGFTSSRGIAYGNGLIAASNGGSNTVQFYNATSGATVGAPVVVGTSPYGIEYNGTEFVVSVLGANQVVFISNTGTPLATLATGTSPFASYSNGSRVFVATITGPINVFDQVSHTLLTTLSASNGWHYMAGVRDELWAIDFSNPGHICVIDADSVTGAVVCEKSKTLGNDPSGICYTGYDMVTIDYGGAWTMRRHTIETRFP
jgi:hypothetical protein